MLEALSIAIDLTLFYCFADTSLSPFGEKKVEEEYRAKAAQPLAICTQKFSKLFAVTHSTSNQPGGGQISLACISSIKDVFVRHIHMHTL